MDQVSRNVYQHSEHFSLEIYFYLMETCWTEVSRAVTFTHKVHHTGDFLAFDTVSTFLWVMFVHFE